MRRAGAHQGGGLQDGEGFRRHVQGEDGSRQSGVSRSAKEPWLPGHRTSRKCAGIPLGI